jgi:FkbM family methyltransferase
MTKSRFKVLYHYFTKNNSVNAQELLKYLFGHSYHDKAQKVIETIISEDNWRKIYFNKYISDPLYYPLDYSMKSLEQVIVECFYTDNWHYYEIEETRVQMNDIVADCGASEGIFSLLVARRCSDVYAVEPLKRFIECLILAFKDMKNVYIIDKALSDREYLSSMSIKGIESTINNKSDGDQINVTTLDKLFYETNIHISYIKMDLEGYEYLALKGGYNLIKQNNPKIAVTTYHNKDHARLIQELLLGINPNYKIKTKGIFQETGCPIMLHAWV